jgi:DNA invertase Pin-like site-specific DNA recombinase
MLDTAMGERMSPSHQGDRRQPTRVAEYVRMSTDHQRYSTENQRDTLGRYAVQHGMTIVQTYADEGKSGLNLDGRDALKQLIHDVQSGPVDFDAVLVYDISRWGRFQDADESAYYEYLCRRSGIQVCYCAEPFDNDGSPMATIMKSVKRAMAGEYSRELSNKVFQGQCHLVELGFRQGGAPGVGLRRMLLDEQLTPKGLLHLGERKSLQTDRVILVPGPDEEVTMIQAIYRAFLEEGKSEQIIAETLNAQGMLTDHHRPWTRGTVHQVLTNEKYIGNNLYNRTSFKLKQRHVRNHPDMWVRKDGAFESIVPTDWFARVPTIIEERARRFDDDTMLVMLRQLFERTGVLSGLLIDEQDGMPSSSTYRTRFGSLVRAYTLVGFRPQRDYRYLAINRTLRARMPNVIKEITMGLEKVGAHVRVHAQTGLLHVNDEFTLSVVLARCMQLLGGTFRWRLRFDTSLAPDITVVVRMAADQSTPLDYYLFPCIDHPFRSIRLAEHDNAVIFDAYRFDDLDLLYALAERRPLRKAA